MEGKTWRHLSASQRARALVRVEALRRWADGRGEIPADDAAKIAGMSTKRFYRIASEWRGNRSLTALGIYARASSRNPKVSSSLLEAISAAARQAILLYGNLSTSALVSRALRLARLPRDTKLPGMTKLREIVQAESRRITTSLPMGQIVFFDCVATSLPRADRRPHIAFLCMDSGTGLVLGVAIGTMEAAIMGYASAANDALSTIDHKGAEWRWSHVFSALRVTGDENVVQIAKIMQLLNVKYLQIHFILERGEKRYGRLIGRTVGPRLGRVTFTPTRTLCGEALATNGDMAPWNDVEAYEVLRRSADDHNDAMFDPTWAGASEMPLGLYDALATMGGGRDQG